MTDKEFKKLYHYLKDIIGESVRLITSGYEDEHIHIPIRGSCGCEWFSIDKSGDVYLNIMYGLPTFLYTESKFEPDVILHNISPFV